MTHVGARLLENARWLDPEEPEARPGSLLVEGGRIAARLAPGERGPAFAARTDLGGRLVAPGFLDVHYHGAFVFSDADDALDDAMERAAASARHGTTGYLATTVAWPAEELGPRVERLAARLAGDLPPGARPLGLHLEGPWIHPEAAGAQPAAAIRPCRTAEVEDVLARAAGSVRMVTLAPEIEGADGLLALLERRGLVAALGHSRARAAEVEAAVARGARHVTHLFNAMGPIHHREPGLAGMALADERLTADLICDGVHVHPAMVRVAAHALRERLLLVTDRIEPPPGASFGSGALRDDGRALTLPDGRLAGSCVTLDRALRNASVFADLPLREAVAACTLRPARLLGLEAEVGTLRVGARADLAVLGDDGRVEETWLGGERFAPA